MAWLFLGLVNSFCAVVMVAFLRRAEAGRDGDGR